MSWDQLLNIIKEGRQLLAEENARLPVARSFDMEWEIIHP
jgi:hypothetical protein